MTPKEEERRPTPSFRPRLGKALPDSLQVRGEPGTVVGRLKSLRRKDLVFILAGLSVLCMAPVAEQVLMGPQDTVASLESGFDRKGPIFPDGIGVYENGTGGLSPGNLIGRDEADVVTPLNVRDPSSLIMGTGAVSRPAAAGAGARGSEWKNAIAQAASRGAQAAVRKAKLPAPSAKISGALRGLASLSGSTSAGGPSLRLDPLSASSVPNRAKESNSLSQVQPTPGFRGAALRSPMAGGGGESLKTAGNRQADIMNKGASAASAVDAAARAAIPSGGAPFGGSGAGEGSETKAPGGNPGKDGKGIAPGENLALLKAKLEMEKSVDLQWKKKSWAEFERQKMVEELLMKSAIEGIVGKGLFEPIGKSIADAFGSLSGGPQGMSCIINGGIVNYTMDEWNRYGKQAAQNGGFLGTCRPWPGSASPAAGGPAQAGSSPASPPARLPSPGSVSGGVEASIPAASAARQMLGGLETRFSGLDAAVQSARREVEAVDAGAWDGKGQWEALVGKIEQGREDLKKAKEELGRAQEGVESANKSVAAALSEDEQALGTVQELISGAPGVAAQLAEGLKRNPVRHGLVEGRFRETISAKVAAVDGAGRRHEQAAVQALGEAQRIIRESKARLEPAQGEIARGGEALIESRAQYARLSMRSVAQAERAIGSVNEAMGALNEAIIAVASGRDQAARSMDLAQESMRKAQAADREVQGALESAGASGSFYQAAKPGWEGGQGRGARDLEGKAVVEAVTNPAAEAPASEARSAQSLIGQAQRSLDAMPAMLQEGAARISAARNALGQDSYK